MRVYTHRVDSNPEIRLLNITVFPKVKMMFSVARMCLTLYLHSTFIVLAVGNFLKI